MRGRLKKGKAEWRPTAGDIEGKTVMAKTETGAGSRGDMRG